jgi:hypothetical protein
MYEQMQQLVADELHEKNFADVSLRTNRIWLDGQL